MVPAITSFMPFLFYLAPLYKENSVPVCIILDLYYNLIILIYYNMKLLPLGTLALCGTLCIFLLSETLSSRPHQQLFLALENEQVIQ